MATKVKVFNSNTKVVLHASKSSKFAHMMTDWMYNLINKCLSMIINIRLPDSIAESAKKKQMKVAWTWTYTEKK